jgi:hypothetical protein
LKKYIICCRKFPLYVRNSILNNKALLGDAIQKLGMLIDVYKSKKINNDLIDLISKEYIKIFEEMIIKLKDVNTTIKNLDNIKAKNKNEYSYIKPPDKKELYKKEDKWENKKLIEERILI